MEVQVDILEEPRRTEGTDATLKDECEMKIDPYIDHKICPNRVRITAETERERSSRSSNFIFRAKYVR